MVEFTVRWPVHGYLSEAAQDLRANSADDGQIQSCSLPSNAEFGTLGAFDLYERRSSLGGIET
jgi:hypothetical protein